MRLIITITLITLLSDSFGQISEFHFTRKNLKGFKKVTSTRINYNGQDSTSYSSIYLINKLGDIVRSEHYDKKELVNWTKYEYYDNGLLKYEESHNQMFSYDEKSKREIGQIEDDTYQGKIFEYSGNLMTRQIYVTCYDGSKSYDNLTLYEYDNSGRLVKEINIDSDLGLTAEFKPNSSVVDSMYYKDKVTRWSTTHLHKADSIISTTYDDNNEIQGYSFTKLNLAKKPIRILITDSQRNEIKSVTRTYDKTGKFVHELVKIIDIDKIDYDLIAGDDYQLFYNNKLLPILVLTKENGEIISKERVRYE